MMAQGQVRGLLWSAVVTVLSHSVSLLSSPSADAFFWVGNSTRPSPEGYIVPYPEDYKGR
jgi:hypothetical protein